MRKTLGVGLLLFLSLLQGSPSFAGIIQLPTTDASWLQTVNYYRQASGLRPIAEKKKLSADVKKHMIYLTMTDPKYFTGQYVSRHLENPASPYYTVAGARSGQELTSTLTNDQSQSVDQWMSAPFHAIGLMREGLRKVGWASVYDPRTGFYDAGADVLDQLQLKRTKTIMFPGNDSYTRLSSFPGESPDPREACGSNSRDFKGLPIWVSLASEPAHHMSAQLITPTGEVLSSRSQLCIVNEFNMKSSDSIYGPAGRAIIQADHMILIIPKDPLTPGLQKVSLSLIGRPKISWSFTVIPRPPDIALTTISSATAITWEAPPVLAENPTLGYEVLVGDPTLKKIQSFRTPTTTFSTAGLSPGEHWVCVKAVGRYRNGDCPSFTSLSVNPETTTSASLSAVKR